MVQWNVVKVDCAQHVKQVRRGKLEELEQHCYFSFLNLRLW